MNAIQERIMTRVVADPGTGCWLWEGTQQKGYGRISMLRDGGGRADLVHRVMYEASVGPISEGMQLDHLCRRHECVRPEHLEPVTPRDNTRRGTALITHCPKGHPYDKANTRVKAAGHRSCKACAVDKNRRVRSTPEGAEANRQRVQEWRDRRVGH